LTLKALPKTKKPTKPKKPKTCTVPKLAGDTLAAAKRALGRTKCKVGTVSTKKSGTVGKGHVISSSPTAGSRHKAGTRVNLAVSGGKQ
jgi:beta-lactam-binding protein with PASTA domain